MNQNPQKQTDDPDKIHYVSKVWRTPFYSSTRYFYPMYESALELLEEHGLLVSTGGTTLGAKPFPMSSSHYYCLHESSVLMSQIRNKVSPDMYGNHERNQPPALWGLEIRVISSPNHEKAELTLSEQLNIEFHQEKLLH